MSLDIILGPMGSGKTASLLTLVSRYLALGVPVLVVSHGDAPLEVVTPTNRRVPSIALRDLGDLRANDIALYKVLLIDDAHFFPRLLPALEFLVDTHGKHVVLVGLDGDSNRKPFGELLECIPLADRVDRRVGTCRQCANGTPAPFTYRRGGPHDQQVLIGGPERYTPLCRACYHDALARERTAS